MTMTLFALFGTLGFECECLLFLPMLSFMILAVTPIVAPVVLKNGLTRMSGI
jgi:hypothetical protein